MPLATLKTFLIVFQILKMIVEHQMRWHVINLYDLKESIDGHIKTVNEQIATSERNAYDEYGRR